MREESTKARDALTRLKFYERQLEWANGRVTQALLKLKDERATYADTRPLTEAERIELAEHVASGGALCCEAGLTWLRERLPEPWAQAINGWAYEHGGCDMSKEARVTFVERLRGLKLDELPYRD